MAEEVNININVTSNVVSTTSEVTKKIDGIKKSAEGATTALDETGSVGNAAIKLIDKATGGLGTKFVQIIKYSKELGTGLLTSFTSGVKAVKTFGTTLVTALRGGTVAANTLKGALIATGIGALVVAVGSLIAYWDDIKAAIGGASQEQKTLLKDAESNVEAQESAAAALALQENSLRLQGKSEKEIRDLKVQQTNETITALEAQLVAQESIKKSQIEAAKRNKEILQAAIRAITLPVAALLGSIDLIGKALGKNFGLEEGFSGGLAKLVFDPEEVATAADETIEETKKQLATLKSTRDGFIVANNAEAAANAKAAADKADKSAADALAKEKERLAALAALQKETADIIDANEEAAIKNEVERENARFKNLQEKLQRERDEQVKAAEGDQVLIAAINAKYNALGEQATLNHLAAIEGFTKASEDKLKAQKEQIANINIGLIENETTRALAALKLKYDAEYAAAEGNAELQLALQKQFISEGAAIQKSADDKAKDDKRKQTAEIKDLVVGSATAIIDNLLSLNNLYDKNDEAAAKRAFERSKKLQILQAIINTASGIMGALGTPNVGDVLTGANFIKAGVIAATGAAQIATIAAQQFDAGGGTTPDAPNAPSAQSLQPQFNIVGQSGTNQLAQSIGGQFDQPIRAYVVGQDVTTSQQLQRQRVRTATFG
jgi:hypothetical protein